MQYLASLDNTLFIGQSCMYAGNAMFNTLEDAKVPMSKRIEMPVAEDMQMGISIGLSLQGYLPISIYPRMDFLIIAMNQLVNHLDKIEKMSEGQFRPKVIIRTGIGSKSPLDGGPQHTGNYIDALGCALKNINIVLLAEPINVFASYEVVANPEYRSSILIEDMNLY